VEPKKQPPLLNLLTADSLLNSALPEPVWIISDLLPVGLAILAGAPKAGKSWLALQIARAVAAGEDLFGQPVNQGPILYLALEDSPQRLRERMTLQAWLPSLPAEFLSLVEFSRQIGDLGLEGTKKLVGQMVRGRYRLIVIDTLSRSMQGKLQVGSLVPVLMVLQEVTRLMNSALLLIDHHRKRAGASPDAITDILGSTAKGALADTALGLYRGRGEHGAELAITGRDIRERTLALTMDWTTGCWQIGQDTAETHTLTEREEEILDALRELGRARLKDVAGAVGQPRSHTHKRLQDLAAMGRLRRFEQDDGKVLYELL